jgi:hypothetical protein
MPNNVLTCKAILESIEKIENYSKGSEDLRIIITISSILMQL